MRSNPGPGAFMDGGGGGNLISCFYIIFWMSNSKTKSSFELNAS
jgi:hypothetical protein